MRKRGLKFYARMYRKILVQDLKSKMSYRADFVISTFGMIMTNLSGFVTFMILFHNFPTINGWDYHHMLFLYGFSLVALTPVQCFFDNNWNLRFMVQSGDFIKYCFRPINVFFYFISEVFDVKGLGQDHQLEGSLLQGDPLLHQSEQVFHGTCLETDRKDAYMGGVNGKPQALDPMRHILQADFPVPVSRRVGQLKQQRSDRDHPAVAHPEREDRIFTPADRLRGKLPADIQRGGCPEDRQHGPGNDQQDQDGKQ